MRPESAIDGALELRLGHLRASLDPHSAGFLIELVTGQTTGTRIRPQAAPTPARDVGDGRSTRVGSLAGPGSFFVHRAGGDLLGEIFRISAVEQSLLDVLVLTRVRTSMSLSGSSAFADNEISQTMR